MTRRAAFLTILCAALAACSDARDTPAPDAAPPAFIPASVTVLASGELRPNGIVADETAVYFVSQGDPLNPTPASAIRKIDLETFAVTTVVADAGKTVRLAADADHVYFATGDSAGRIVMIDKRDGSTKDLATGQTTAGSIAVDADAVYWQDDASTDSVLRSVKKDGTGLRDIGSPGGGQTFDLIADDSRLYAAASNGLVAMDKSSGATTMLATGNFFNTNLAQDATSIYWTDRKDLTIDKVAKTGGAPVTLASNQPTPPGRLAVTGDGGVYWTLRGDNANGSTTQGAVRALPAGANTPIDIATGLDHAIEPAVLSHAVVWTVYGPTDSTTTPGGSVMAAPL